MDDVFSQIQGVYSGSPAQPDSSNDIFSQIKGTYSPDISKAKNDLGSQADNNECQRFVEKVTNGKTGIYPSAYDAFNDYAQKGKAKSKGEPGDMVYFSPNEGNRNDGHVGILTNDGEMISATPHGVGIAKVKDWEAQTGQTVLGYVTP